MLLEDVNVFGTCNLTGKKYVHSMTDRPDKSHFVVKIQVPFKGPKLIVYIKERSLYGLLERSKGGEELYDLLVKKIKEEGVDDYKGFFYAIYTKNNSMENILEINPFNILPVEKW